MPYITNGNDAALLQLQYLAESIGLNRSYLKVDSDNLNIEHDIPVEAVKRPDIEWHPSYETYQARGFPDQISSPRVWTGSDFADPVKFLVHLSAEDVEEIKAALAFFKGLDGDNLPDDVSTKTFPLPTLGARLREVAVNIHLGTGFNVIRGLNPADFSPLDNVLIYLGITSYIAEIRGCQDYDGRMIVHIKDIERELPESTGRPSPYTNRAQPFHTDMCDILSMYVLDTAVQGGESLLASSGMIYNEIAATRPDIIHLLADDKWIHDEPLLFNFEKHGPGFCYSRRPLTGAPFSPHHPQVPAMTEEQAEAIDAVHFTAVKHQLTIKLEPGDIEIFNNLALMHARNAFVDSDQPEARDVIVGDSHETRRRSLNGKRHMLRLWLRSADDKLVWKTPKALEANSFEIYGDSEARKLAKWDVHRAPPINRVLTKHFKCS
ncbi:uncharacterized protein THITE_2141213 [Thermothielavioides terrestris NRRL 8126]|uniref:TauD/TfdA-like domain-containing protein n=1 Tax=Thermothielavioides terrestris (strain ATCC 38088 / NRRL 8126) TaxID=578455 RepID=G2QVN8_THETT|nr:uncharacterized protein THITE_2141213 [Thermothielavioides terrestris NRRL 8126]AEO63019.1 hypothetical protein THITE_2141213 [Thermothielavioides terrestris NRRL 8126]